MRSFFETSVDLVNKIVQKRFKDNIYNIVKPVVVFEQLYVYSFEVVVF